MRIWLANNSSLDNSSNNIKTTPCYIDIDVSVSVRYESKQIFQVSEWSGKGISVSIWLYRLNPIALVDFMTPSATARRHSLWRLGLLPLFLPFFCFSNFAESLCQNVIPFSHFSKSGKASPFILGPVHCSRCSLIAQSAAHIFSVLLDSYCPVASVSPTYSCVS